MSRPEEAPWFAGEDGDFLLFRVNRRPLRENNLFAPEGLPPDVFEHFVAVLAPGYEVVTGRRRQRTWRVGGLQVESDRRFLLGKLGWVPRGEEIVSVWSEEDHDWISTTAEQRGGRVVPFGFDGETRLLTVLSDRRSAPLTVAHVFEKILNGQERQLLERTTDWAVEPILDAADFKEWLRSVDVIRLVSFAARLPNPEPRDAFRDLAGRMEQRHATLYRETMRSDRENGLVGIEEDPDFRQAIAMGEQGFATLRGQAFKDGAVVRYSQTDTVAWEHVETLPATWESVRLLIYSLLRGRLRRFLDSDD